MISRKEFFKLMKEYKKIIDCECKILKAFRELSPDHSGFSFIRHTVLIDSLLRHLTIDYCDWIGYFIYDLDWGKRYKPGTVTGNDGKNVKLKTLDDLYNILEENYSESNINRF